MSPEAGLGRMPNPPKVNMENNNPTLYVLTSLPYFIPWVGWAYDPNPHLGTLLFFMIFSLNRLGKFFTEVFSRFFLYICFVKLNGVLHF